MSLILLDSDDAGTLTLHSGEALAVLLDELDSVDVTGGPSQILSGDPFAVVVGELTTALVSVFSREP